MAYRITYEWEKESQLLVKPRLSFGAWFGITLLSAALAVRLMVPQSEAVFQKLFYPLFDESTAAVFAELISDVSHGAPVDEAVVTFCREIIENGGQ